MSTERRRNRSNDPLEAAALYLETAARRRSYAALTLSTAEGDLVADAPSRLNSNALAALAPLAGPGNHSTDGLLHLVTRGEPIQILDIDIEGRAHYLSAVGDGETLSYEAESTLRRILA